MTQSHNDSDLKVLYEPDERPPLPLTVGLGLQNALLAVTGIVLAPIIVVRAAQMDDAYLNWTVFAALLVSGISTVLQVVRIGRIGSGYILVMGSTAAYLAAATTALTQSGPAMLATLIVFSSMVQFVIGTRLSLLRRVLTPTVAGVVIMLIPVSVAPVVFDMLTQVPEDVSPLAAPMSAAATMVVIAAIALRMTGAWRLWAPLIGILVGCAVGGVFGLYDIDSVRAASWIGVPGNAWPGLDLSFGPTFWALLPAFVLVTLVSAIDTIGDTIGIQQVSWRKPRAADYRSVQGAVTADGIGNLLAGIAGTMPNTTYSTSASVVELTGVASRRVGICVGILFAALAFLPKLTALIVAIPEPVAAAYITVLLAILFSVGVKIVFQDGADFRKTTVVGLSFWLGVGFQNQAIFADQLGEWWGGLLENGMTAGSLVAILLTMFMEVTGPRRKRIQTTLDMAATTKIADFLKGFAAKAKWGPEATHRLMAAGEETFLTLADEAGDERGEGKPARRGLRVTARLEGNGIEVEFIAAAREEMHNIEDRIVFLWERNAGAIEQDVSLRLLRHYASSVRHQRYHQTEIVTLSVDPRGKPAAGDEN